MIKGRCLVGLIFIVVLLSLKIDKSHGVFINHYILANMNPRMKSPTEFRNQQLQHQISEQEKHEAKEELERRRQKIKTLLAFLRNFREPHRTDNPSNYKNQNEETLTKFRF